jgi:membrane protease YdiL (CAAX protease family)
MELKRNYPGLGHAILLCAMVVAFQSALVLPFSIADMALKTGLTRHPGFLAAINLAAIGATVGLGLLIGKVRLRQVLFLNRVPLKVFLPLLLISIGGGILLSEIDNLFRSVFPIPDWLARILQGLLDTSRSPWGAFLALVIVAPLTEEVLMRGFILPGLLNQYRRWRAIAVSALLFAALHLNPWQFFSAAFLGVVLAWYFVRTQSLWPCLVAHAFHNGMVFGNGFLPFSIRGFNTGDPFQRPELQPLWFDALGILLVVAGCWLFARLTDGLVAPAAPVPPLILEGQAAPDSLSLPAGPGQEPPVIVTRS